MGWRLKLGIVIFVVAFALWLLISLAAALDIPSACIAAEGLEYASGLADGRFS